MQGHIEIGGHKINGDSPILIAGPTASGKSALALRIAEALGGCIVNADALQVYSCWNVLTARPGADDLSLCRHELYGHVEPSRDYSVGTWLREIERLISIPGPMIIVGGTGLYFRALTNGLADIPAVPAEIQYLASQRTLADMVSQLDKETAAVIDVQNRRRVERAWAVLRHTGKGLANWHQNTPAALLPIDRATPLVVEADTDWLNQQIEKRFTKMIENGAVEEVRNAMESWDLSRPAFRAIGAQEIAGYLRGDINLTTAQEQATIATRQYAKRQRTWFRNNMQAWSAIDARELAG